MCAILDASAVADVFRPNATGAAGAFYEWIRNGRGRLVVGGKLREELWEGSGEFRRWYPEAVLSGRVISTDDDRVSAVTADITTTGLCRSNDQHVIALAQVSGARLLYANDKKLQKDFGDRTLISRPRGKVYSTKKHPELRPHHKQLLRRNTCRLG